MKRMLCSMRFKMVLMVSGMTLCLMTFSLFFFHLMFSQYLKNSVNESLRALVKQTTETLEYSFSMLENTMTYFFSNKTLQEWFSDENVKTADAEGQLVSKIQLDESLRHTLMLNSAWQNNLMDSAFFIVNRRCFSFYSQGKAPVFELTQRSLRIFDRLNEAPLPGILASPPEPDEQMFYLAKRYPDDLVAISLTLILCVDEDTLREKYTEVMRYPGAIACILSPDGTVYSSADKAQLGKPADELTGRLMSMGSFGELAADGETYYALCQRISTTGLSFVVGVPQSGLYAYAQSVSYRYVAILVPIFLGFLALTILVSYRSTLFLRDITSNLTEIKRGNYRVRMPDYQTTELSELSSTFNGMADKVDYLINEVYEKQLAVKRADIRHLQSQIHPHFLFNALAAISTKAKLAKEESIYDMVRSVSTLLQAGMNDGIDMVPVSEELEYVRCYLHIQKQRFGEKLLYEIYIQDDSLLAAYIPRLCVEPIVENAVIHGLEVKPSRGRVTLSVLREGEDILFVVEDDGVGFKHGAKPLREPQNAEHREPIGLNNTHKRLQLIYGEEYGVFIDEHVSVGARVTVRIPHIREGMDDVPRADCR